MLSLDRRPGSAGLPSAFGSVQRVQLAAPELFDAEIWLDGADSGRGSVEVFADGGAVALTDLVGTRITRVELVAVGDALLVDEWSAEVPRTMLAGAEGRQA